MVRPNFRNKIAVTLLSSIGIEEKPVETNASISIAAARQAPADPHMNGTGLRFETLDHGGEYPDTMPQAIRLSDPLGRTCLYLLSTQNGKVVDTNAKVFDDDEEE